MFNPLNSWVYFNPTQKIPIVYDQYWVSLNHLIQISKIRGSLPTHNKVIIQQQNSNSITQVYPAPLALLAIAFTTSFYE